MNNNDYIKSSVLVKIKEDELLDTEDFYRLNESNSLDELLENLRNTPYYEDLSLLDDIRDYEKVLKKNLEDSFRYIKELSNDQLLKYIIEKYNFHNLKVIAKELILDRDNRYLYSDIANIDNDYIKGSISNKKEDEFDISFKNKKENPEDIYVKYLKDTIDIYEESKNPMDIDINLDKYYYQKLLEDAKDLEIESLYEYTKNHIDLINLKMIIRLMAQDDITNFDNVFIEGGNVSKETFLANTDDILKSIDDENLISYLKDLEGLDLDSMSLKLENMIDKYELDFFDGISNITYGREVLINYIIRKEIEIKNLRLIFIAKINDLSKDFIKERII